MQRQKFEAGPLAALLGLTESEFIDCMEGRVRLAPTDLVLLANTLDIPLLYFFGVDPRDDIPSQDN